VKSSKVKADVSDTQAIASIEENASFSQATVSVTRASDNAAEAAKGGFGQATVSVAMHPVFGEGSVLESRFNHTEILVKFRSGLTLWLPLDRVKLISRPAQTLDEISAKRMVEAFRLGIVPHQDVEEFTFGRQSEIYALEEGLRGLKDGSGGAYLVEGDYGTGKTHLLEYSLHTALKMGIVTSTISFDPQEVTPHRPKRVYRDIVHNLRYLDQSQEGSFRDLLRRATQLAVRDHCFFTPVLARLKRISTDDPVNEVFWQMVEGESTKEYAVEYSSHRIKGGYRIPALYDFSTAADFYCYILSGLSSIAHQLGFGGLALVVDEAETVTHLWDSFAFSRGINFLEGIIRTGRNDPDLTRLDSRLIHNQVRPTPYIYGTPHLLLIIATTPTPYDYTYIKLTHLIENRLTLAPLAVEDLTRALGKLVEIYRHAYPGFALSLPDQKRILADALRAANGGMRLFLKFSVETLDIARLRYEPAPGQRT